MRTILPKGTAWVFDLKRTMAAEETSSMQGVFYFGQLTPDELADLCGNSFNGWVVCALTIAIATTLQYLRLDSVL